MTPDTFMGWQQGEFVSAVLLGFAGVAVILAAFGLFSVASYAIAHRTREFSIRLALGATRRTVLREALQSTAIRSLSRASNPQSRRGRVDQRSCAISWLKACTPSERAGVFRHDARLG
jgi:hypothetical protein